MKKISFLILFLCLIPFLSFCQIIDDENGDWSLQFVTLYDTPEAEIMVRAGDIDNLGFGWPSEFNPFSGYPTLRHSFPWAPDILDAMGTDRIMVVTSYEGSPPSGSDGYTLNTSRPENLPRPIVLNYDLYEQTIEQAMLQIFVDDFQAPVWGADYFVSINNFNIPLFADIVNQLTQTGPIGKIINVSIPSQYFYLLESDSLSILFDDLSTGAGDGYAIDFVKLLINPSDLAFSAKVYGTITNAITNIPIEGVTVRASSDDETITDENGYYFFNQLPAGINEIVVTKFGNDTATALVDLVAGDSIERNFVLNEILEAEYTADFRTAFSAPHIVQFTDLTSMNPTAWNWDFGDGGTSVEQNPSHTYMEDGVYSVTLYAENAEESNTEIKVNYIQIGVEGIEHINQRSNIKIYPNPTSQNTTLSFTMKNEGVVEIELSDFAGRSINHLYYELPGRGDQKIWFNNDNLKDGIYFIRITIDDNVYTKKMIILRK